MTRPANPTRSDAVRNRDLLVAAAREVLAEQGLDAPMSAVAKRAGVGQGTLYRHFPDRLTLARAVLDENVAHIEEVAARPGATLADVLGVITWQMIHSIAFVSLIRLSGEETSQDLADRVRTAVDGLPTESHATGTRDTDDVMLAVAMVSGAVHGPTEQVREATARRAWQLLGIEIGEVTPDH
ncbi:AcrR family transcriptional regulator [Nocardioides luteus]|uniref:TetR family transcriptional regulator n=1 Tax=Nocardioides luteus TaxID=1844 RepID=A0ABQ5STY5_9ACTN|nr:helix-turn-helix domain-containing protein [Nocardioides luteus]MDR7309084.1 AcrR family transcriptional regulator [Nocardioides luteus]GGR49852.1 TetR family transcriptional regulator [Nocardioides luteus]GLJ67490.1 TetR family transcriptional regulator [Nocardioides luteus]